MERAIERIQKNLRARKTELARPDLQYEHSKTLLAILAEAVLQDKFIKPREAYEKLKITDVEYENCVREIMEYGFLIYDEETDELLLTKLGIGRCMAPDMVYVRRHYLVNSQTQLVGGELVAERRSTKSKA